MVGQEAGRRTGAVVRHPRTDSGQPGGAAAQRRGQRITVIGSLAAAVVAIGLAATAFVFQRQAEEATVEATRGAARLAVNVAGSLLDQGQVDEPAVLLLEAAKAFDDTTANDEMLIAFHRVNQAYAQTRSYGLPAGAKAVEGPDALYFIDPEANAVLRFDASGAPAEIYAAAGSEPIRQIGFTSIAGAFHLIVVHRDGLVRRIDVATKQKLFDGTLPNADHATVTPDIDDIAIHGNGVVTANLSIGGEEARDTQFRLLDTRDGRIFAAEVPTSLVYLVDAAGNEYGYGGPDFFSEGSEFYRIDPAGSLSTANLDSQDYAELNYRTCLLNGLMSNADYRDGLFGGISADYGTFQCQPLADDILVSKFQSTSAGVDRSDFIVRMEGTVTDLDELLSSFGKSDTRVDLSWLGVEPVRKRLGAVRNRELIVFGEFGIDRTFSFPDAPGPARFTGENEIAIVQAWANRVVVQAIHEVPRDAISDQRQEAVVSRLQKLTPLNFGSCSGYAFFGDYFEAATRLADGATLSIEDLVDDDPEQTIQLTPADGASRILDVPPGQQCLQMSADGHFLTGPLSGDTSSAGVYDFEKIRRGASLEASRLDGPAGFMSSVFPLGDGLVTTNAEHAVLFWSRDQKGNWISSVAYKGDNVVFYAEPDVDGKRLLIIESLGRGDTHGFLYSVEAGRRWIELGTDYKWFGLAFASDETVTAGARGVQRMLKLPSLSTLVEETAGQLPARCRPADGASYRTSPCWPASL